MNELVPPSEPEFKLFGEGTILGTKEEFCARIVSVLALTEQSPQETDAVGTLANNYTSTDIRALLGERRIKEPSQALIKRPPNDDELSILGRIVQSREITARQEEGLEDSGQIPENLEYITMMLTLIYDGLREVCKPETKATQIAHRDEITDKRKKYRAMLDDLNNDGHISPRLG